MELHYWRKFSEFVLSLIKWVVADVVGNVEEGSGRGVCFMKRMVVCSLKIEIESFIF